MSGIASSDVTSGTGRVLDAPHDSVRRARAGLHDLGATLRADLAAVEQPHLRSLLVTTAELLDALDQAFADAEEHAGHAPAHTFV